ncbi:uncharacterized protein LOC142535136 [Primulina tabacum]|uniref:uncharacterized protein LOC142535136 n=1 Tax=Primulina tabacum TaxID=48773 RepID=UPI003F5A4C43
MELPTFFAAFCVALLAVMVVPCASDEVHKRLALGQAHHFKFAAMPLFPRKLKLNEEQIMGVKGFANQAFMPHNKLKEAPSGTIFGKREERVKVPRSENLSTMDYNWVRSRLPIHN